MGSSASDAHLTIFVILTVVLLLGVLSPVVPTMMLVQLCHGVSNRGVAVVVVAAAVVVVVVSYCNCHVKCCCGHH